MDLPLYVYDDLTQDAAIQRIAIRLVLRAEAADARVVVSLNGHPLSEIRRDPEWSDNQVYGA